MSTQSLRTDLNLIVLASVGGRVASFIQQVVLAGVLAGSDYGIAAAALGVFSITAILRNGGAWMPLGALRPDEFEREGPPIFWACLGVCLLGAGASLAVAPFASERFASTEVGWVMVVYAAQLVVSGFEQYSRAKLRSDLRLRALSLLLSSSSVLQCVVAIVLAFSGAGVYALAVPMLVGSILDALVCQSLSGFSPSSYRFSLRQALAAMRGLLPVLVLSVLTSINMGMDYLIASTYLGTAALGTYAFAYKIASQPYMLLTMSLQRVLVPASVAASEDPIKRERWLSGMATTVFFVVPAVCTALAISFPAADQAIWGGKWADSAFLVSTLCIGLSGPVALGILITPLLADRKYSVVLATEAIRSASVIAGAFLGLLVISRMPVMGEGDQALARGLALGVSSVTTLTSVMTALWLLREAGLRVKQLFEALVAGPLACFLGGYGAYSVGISLERSFDMFDGRIGAAAVGSVTLLIYGIMLLCALQLLPTLHDPYRNLIEPLRLVYRRLCARAGHGVD